MSRRNSLENFLTKEDSSIEREGTKPKVVVEKTGAKPKVKDFRGPKPKVTEEKGSGRTKKQPNQKKDTLSKTPIIDLFQSKKPAIGAAVPKRPLSSPEAGAQCSKKQIMSDDRQLLASLESMLDQKLQNIATKDDLNDLREDLRQLKIEKENLVEKVQLLSAKIDERDKRLEYLENFVRKKNLIIRGCKYIKEDDVEAKAKTFITEVLQVPEPVKIDGTRRIGSKGGEGSMLLITLATEAEKWSIIKKSIVLKNTGYSVSQDFAPITRLRRNKLLAVRALCRRDPRVAGLRMNLRGEKLFINDKPYLWVEEQGLATYEGRSLSIVKGIEGLDLTELIARLLAEERKQNFSGSSSSQEIAARFSA